MRWSRRFARDALAINLNASGDAAPAAGGGVQVFLTLGTYARRGRRLPLSPWLDQDEAKAVAVLATATVRQLGRTAPVVVHLQRLLRERTKDAFEEACDSFDGLDADVRARIASSAPLIARSRLRKKRPPPTLGGLIGVLNRR